MTLLNTLWTRLNYQSSTGRERERLFSLVQALVKAQFQLADAELTRRTWQEVADQNVSVERVEHLLYCCCFQEDVQALKTRTTSTYAVSLLCRPWIPTALASLNTAEHAVA